MARPSSPATPSLQTAINYINQSKPKHLCLSLLCGCVAFWVLFCFDRLERLRTMPKKHTRCPSATCPYSPWKSAEKFHPWQIQSDPTPDPDLNATNWKSPRQIKGPGQTQLGTKTQQSSDNIRHMSHQTRMLSYSRSWQVTECHSTACLSFCNSSKASEPCARPASSKA